MQTRIVTLCGTRVRYTDTEGEPLGREVLEFCCDKPTIKPSANGADHYCMKCRKDVNYVPATFEDIVEANRKRGCPIPRECAEHTEWQHSLELMQVAPI